MESEGSDSRKGKAVGQGCPVQLLIHMQHSSLVPSVILALFRASALPE